MRIRQERIDRHTIDGSYDEQADAFARYASGGWRLISVGPKPIGEPGRYSPGEFRAVFERVIEEKEEVS